MPGGRPLKFRTLKELEQKIAEFRQFIKETSRPMTLERLAWFLGCSTELLRRYGKEKEEFHGTIVALREEIKADKIERLNTPGNPVAGIIFDLKNNHGMKDKTETDVNLKGDINIGDAFSNLKKD